MTENKQTPNLSSFNSSSCITSTSAYSPLPSERKDVCYSMYGELIRQMIAKYRNRLSGTDSVLTEMPNKLVNKTRYESNSEPFNYALELTEYFFCIPDRLATIRISSNDKISIKFIEIIDTSVKLIEPVSMFK